MLFKIARNETVRRIAARIDLLDDLIMKRNGYLNIEGCRLQVRACSHARRKILADGQDYQGASKVPTC